MNMKKLGALLMALVMVLSLSVTAFAVDPTSSTLDLSEGNTSATHGVYGIIDVENESSATKVYKVDITWGSLVFTYIVNAGSRTTKWDPETHTYVSTTEGGYAGTWGCQDGADKVTLKNHSNAAMKATFTFTNSLYSTITPSMKDDSNNDLTANGTVLASAVGTSVADAPSVTGIVSLTGDLPYTVNNGSYQQLFNLTVALAEHTA